MTATNIRLQSLNPWILRKNGLDQFFRVILIGILGYEGAGALLGGTMLILQPDGALMNIPMRLLHGAFSNFLVPGLVLLFMGVITSISFVAVIRGSRWDWIFAMTALTGFTIWFIVEIMILNELHWLHLMWGVPVLLGLIVAIPLVIQRNPTKGLHKLLLSFGIISSLWYLTINIFVPLGYDGYSISNLTVSELSAIKSPTRITWVLLVWLYPVLLAAFGFGILESQNASKRLRIIGLLIVVYSAFNIYWPPMHMRGELRTISDTLHIIWASVTVDLMIAIMIMGVLAFNNSFRIYTILSIVALLLFGTLTFREAPNISLNEPTPMIGIWERINIGVFMLWTILLSVILLRRSDRK